MTRPLKRMNEMISPAPITAASVLRVLLIEDDEADVFLVQEILKGGATRSALPAFELLVAGTLADGLARLRSDSVDVVLLDLMLPDSRGMDSLRRVVAEGGTVPVVVLSNMNDEQTSMEAARNGAQDYLVKGHVEAMWLARIMRYAVARKAAISVLRAEIEDLTRVSGDSLLAAALDVTSDAIFILNPDGSLRHRNAAARDMTANAPDQPIEEWFLEDRPAEKGARLRVVPVTDGGETGALLIAISGFTR